MVIMPTLGLDFGEKRIGLAISDEGGRIAHGLTVIERKGKRRDFERLKDIVTSRKIEEIVIGLPKRLNGTLGPTAERILEFAEELRSLLKINVKLWDERFTTAISQRVLIEGNLSRKKRKKQIDKLSAVLILQNYLDSLKKKFENFS